ncbi:unnamed protein product [Ciceribacter sp. T2.26MG-112.2]|nr:unnamed protein product [Ciceribacter naphthalenivorans]
MYPGMMRMSASDAFMSPYLLSTALCVKGAVASIMRICL